MPVKPIPLWKEAPFLRLIIPLICGIIFQWYLQVSMTESLILLTSSTGLYLIFQFNKTFVQFKLYWLNGIILNAMLFAVGMLLVYCHDISHQQKWINNYYKNGNAIVGTLQEPLSAKEKSYKALASVQYIVNNDTLKEAKGSILLYLKKTVACPGFLMARK